MFDRSTPLSTLKEKLEELTTVPVANQKLVSGVGFADCEFVGKNAR